MTLWFHRVATHTHKASHLMVDMNNRLNHRDRAVSETRTMVGNSVSQTVSCGLLMCPADYRCALQITAVCNG